MQTFWFIVIAFFWTGFFVLEGFDLGVGSLHMIVGKTDVERRVAINSILSLIHISEPTRRS